MPRVTGLWVYQTVGQRPDPQTVATRAQEHGIRWLTAQAIEGVNVGPSPLAEGHEQRTPIWGYPTRADRASRLEIGAKLMRAANPFKQVVSKDK
jgi:hypothetical protein